MDRCFCFSFGPFLSCVVGGRFRYFILFSFSRAKTLSLMPTFINFYFFLLQQIFFSIQKNENVLWKGTTGHFERLLVHYRLFFMCVKISCIEFVRSCYMRLFREDNKKAIRVNTFHNIHRWWSSTVTNNFQFHRRLTFNGDKMWFEGENKFWN